MIVAPRGAALGAARPLLRVVVLEAGALAEPSALSFAVFDVSDDDKLLQPVQVFPGTGEHPVDLDLDRVPGPLDVGHYAAAWTVPALEPLGKHEVRWTVVTPSGTRTYREEFDVAVGAVGGSFDAYALPSDLRDEGVGDDFSEARLQRALARATEYVEKVTRRFFGPRVLSLSLDGSGSGEQRVDAPVIALASASYVDEAGSEALQLSDVRVYNRWLTEGLTSPDDRDDPRVGWVAPERPFPFPDGNTRYRAWTRGRQNVRLVGIFGYTEPDGSPTGRVPDRIREVTKLLALRDLPGAWSDPETRAEVRSRGRLVSETTRDQSYTLGRDLRVDAAEFTGDPDIDQVLVDFMAPPYVGST